MTTELNVVLSEYVTESLMKAYVVPIARVCNARCLFCATDIYDPKVPLEVMSLDELPAAAEVLVRHGVTRFEITGGGEPTLHPNLTELVSILRAVGPECATKIYTNGARPSAIPVVDEVNISRVAWASVTNQSVMGIRGGSPELESLLPLLRDRGIPRLRLSVPILKGGVSSLPEARALLEHASGYVDGIVFRPLYPATPNKNSLLVDWEAAQMREEILSLQQEFVGVRIEVDEYGCFRSSQLILASNLGVYRDWGLRDLAPGWTALG